MEGICPKCENPLVEVEYFAAKKGSTQVTGRKDEWDGATVHKVTYSFSTQYSNITPLTALCCPYCLARKANHKAIARCIVSWGIALAPVPFIILFFTSERGGVLQRVGFLLTFAGFGLWSLFKKIPNPRFTKLPWRKRDTPLAPLQARLDSSLQDELSWLYVEYTPSEEIPHPKGTDFILSRSMVRNLMNQN